MTRFVLRALAGIPVWLAYFTLMTPLVVLGLVLVPLMAALDTLAAKYWPFNPITFTWGTRKSQQYPGRTVTAWLPRWMWLWGNEEDGLDGVANGFWPKPVDYIGWAEAWQIIRWSALRNSVGNARWTRLFGMTVTPARVRIVTPGYVDLKRGPYVARQDWRYELRFPWSATRFFWVGWRIAQQTQTRAGVGFAFQPFGKV